jgi:hypothetical protein
LVGGDAEAAARRALPPAMREGSNVEDSGGVSVRVRVPRLFPALPHVSVKASTELPSGG